MSIFDQIRTNAKKVVEQAEHVTISDQAIEELSLRPPQKQDFSTDPARRFRGDVTTTVDFVLMLDAVNFGAGWRDDLRREGSLSGDQRFYSTIMGALDRYVTQNGVPPAEDLRDISMNRLSQIFELAADKTAASQLLLRFQESLKDYASYLLEHHNGSGIDLVQSCSGSADKFVRSLASIPSYYDVSDYKGLSIPLYKRAQIAAADLQYALEHKGPVFQDIDDLTAFADPALPQILNALGVLEYSGQLQKIIDSQTELPSGCPEEVEIRAATIEAIERIRAANPHMRVMDIDFVLWNMAGQEDLKYHPRHITKTMSY